jgi:serine/threonine protein kinase
MIFIIISACIILLLLILLIIVGIKYFQMKKIVDKSYFNLTQPDGVEDKSQPPMTQLSRIRLPDNFASTQQVRTLLSYVNGDTLPNVKDDFKELGHGQYGVVYQVNLPDVGLVAAKLLPQSIRDIERRRDKHKKTNDSEESQEMIVKQKEDQMKKEDQKKKAAEMLIDEIKVMHKAGKHVNIVALKKVAYPETKFKFLFLGGPIRDEDSFYLMELCSNGSLESMLKRFIIPSTNTSRNKLSLYETLSKQIDLQMTVEEAHKQCLLNDDDLKLIAYQVASGVDYLNRRQIAHCDIASRNVLVTSRFIMKICDFGLEFLLLDF